MSRTIVDALKDFGKKVTGTTPDGETIVEVIDNITAAYPADESAEG